MPEMRRVGRRAIHLNLNGAKIGLKSVHNCVHCKKSLPWDCLAERGFLPLGPPQSERGSKHTDG